MRKTAYKRNVTQTVIDMMALNKELSPAEAIAEVRTRFKGLSQREAERAVDLAVHQIETNTSISEEDMDLALGLRSTRSRESAIAVLISRGRNYVAADLLMRMANAAHEAACR